jgi:hypothetical protein
VHAGVGVCMLACCMHVPVRAAYVAHPTVAAQRVCLMSVGSVSFTCCSHGTGQCMVCEDLVRVREAVASVCLLAEYRVGGLCSKSSTLLLKGALAAHGAAYAPCTPAASLGEACWHNASAGAI